MSRFYFCGICLDEYQGLPRYGYVINDILDLEKQLRRESNIKALKNYDITVFIPTYSKLLLHCRLTDDFVQFAFVDRKTRKVVEPDQKVVSLIFSRQSTADLLGKTINKFAGAVRRGEKEHICSTESEMMKDIISGYEKEISTDIQYSAKILQDLNLVQECSDKEITPDRLGDIIKDLRDNVNDKVTFSREAKDIEDQEIEDPEI